MDRNEPCFCGSGKKYKKCHADIHPDSFFGNLIKLYNDTDTLIKEKNPETKCTKGCSKCCYQNFNVSPLEFAYIFHNLLKKDKDFLDGVIDAGYKQWLSIERDNPTLANRLESNDECEGDRAMYYIKEYMNGMADGIQNNSFPCPFLSDNICSVYELRPFVCRHHGVGFIDNRYIFADMVFCENTTDGINGTKLTNLSELDVRFLVSMYSKTLNRQAICKGYPIFYHCKIYKENLDSSISKLSEYKCMSMEMASTQRINRALNRMK